MAHGAENLTSTRPPSVGAAGRPSIADRAAAAAAAAAAHAGVDVVALDDMERIQMASDLFTTVWTGAAEHPLISANTLRALEHAGNYAFGAFKDRRMVGAIVGFFGRVDGLLQLHSHILGVLPVSQGRRVGFALKQHQRAWALAQGLAVVTWTFDPLVRRNAYFNLAKLGAAVRAYHPNFYGEMDDGINGGDESDRVLVEWALGSESVAEAGEGRPVEPDLGDLPPEGVTLVLQQRGDGGPAMTAWRPGAVLMASIPEDIVGLRATSRDLANRWRRALRDVFAGALEQGYTTAGMTRSGSYVLRPPGR